MSKRFITNLAFAIANWEAERGNNAAIAFVWCREK